MRKENLIEIILGTIGGLIFSLGMCMCLIIEWSLFTAGVITTIIGSLLLLAIIPIYKKSHPKKEKKNLDKKKVLFTCAGITGALIMGYGMSLVMIEDVSNTNMIIGLIIGITGLIICILNYPIYAYLSNK